ncbi:A/G-specific adenine glycosylase [Candidatus Uhrbacteria bacterium CG_4_9_14_3_um_filter_50_9]|uniref:A/G-specific adenine glycosylase n=1 Tax=Candidatus Uhrbacteria bacterium CG_4_9_14_3_um_filter_50_9 TaxID=1975035 RepID=A0A2M7XE40_9BACT|nr:MAG: A/G-specific adenine glycosylase [Candidatus Uhrbacteria bacterium CG_4_9_14_3_um_filter_50_9]
MTPAATLLNWYRRNGRNLPWRRTRDPYRILISEIMLQQTQVDRVKEFYRRWLKTFPTWKNLAEASNADVIHAWAGLGYNRRALALRDIARHIVQAGVPQSEEAWLRLKGIGPYTAAALSAFAQKKRTLPIDTNIRRVLGRFLFGIPFPELKDDKRILKRTDGFLPRRGHYYDVPQALFDLAAMICTKDPNCARCPLRHTCKAANKFLSGRVNIPKRSTPAPQEHRHEGKKYPDRIYRGRILKLVRETGSVTIENVGKEIDPHYDVKQDHEWVHAMIERLVTDGMIKKKKNKLSL